MNRREPAFTESEFAALVEAEKRHQWHPFTQMQEWCAPGHEPLVLVGGQGSMLYDARGRAYIDGNSSIWTNIHGHNHPRINAAITDQLGRVAHTSYLGFTHPGAIRLGAELIDLFPAGTMNRVFFSDDGSTAMEVAIKMAAQHWQQRGAPERTRFVAFRNAYHGDTMGASSLGGVQAFHGRFSPWHFPADHVGSMEELEALPRSGTVAAVVIEPLMQGVNGMRLWPTGMLRQLRAWCDATGALLIADEVMTGFGRTGRMFAWEHEGVVPDIMAVAKGLTGGYLPMAATFVREWIYESFLGGPDEMKTLFYGHSYTANPLGCAAALASLDIFRLEAVLERVAARAKKMRELLGALRESTASRWVAEIRQLGLIAGIEVMADPGKRVAFEGNQQIGRRICEAARAHGLLTRPIGDVLVLMPPLCVSEPELEQAIAALHSGIDEVCGR